MHEQRQRADALRNADRIVRAAIAILGERGPEVSLEEIARHAGIGSATVYRRFGDRDGVIRAAFETYFAEEVEPLVVAARDAADPGEALAGVLTATVDTLAAHHGLLKAARQAGASTVDIAARFMGPLGTVLDRAQRAGQVRADLVARDLAAIVIMALATAHPADPAHQDPRRYLALLLSSLRPSGDELPAPSSARLLEPSPRRCPQV
ncbi:TetR/AcrR family transcriptional regulator [Nonomuraea gerenzanensis]|uniref:Transcriptional regulator, TetR family n=1 Tax=Nonomuraea gerenzanensis TaxID=93944 RepID=A0A1M4EAA6_9ACTN|nr:TetR/AcrR family transcriptional regulator [Nonomuraea gerenzanensis]UBU17942.1 TetR/AcrR family transcriptional regulator [Nonomuraea gerenzanensis]SBO95740.1 Transcriptional regulator, TetR family [Nonomuraea gerenzanensis]